MGVADDLLPAELLRRKARDFLASRSPGKDKRSSGGLMGILLDQNPLGRAIVLRTARARVQKQTGGHYPAPLKILDVIRKGYGKPIERALEIEAAALGELIVSSVSKNLLHLFHLREAARKGTRIPGLDQAGSIQSIGVVGAGVMGGEIAQVSAYRDIRVRLKDIRHEAISGGLKHASDLFDKAVSRRKLTRREAAEKMELISGGIDYSGVGAADLVVEAVVERMDVKKAVLAELEDRVSSDCILASNTSSLSIGEMAKALKRPGSFCGVHFFNPVHRMPLVEIVRGPETSPDTIASAASYALALGKIPVVVNDGPGFLVNRILGPYLNEAGFLLGDGVSVKAVDRVGVEFGMPMGPIRLIDEIGIDIANHAGASLHEAFGERMKPAPVLEAASASGKLGRKGGAGFYTYADGKAQEPDPQFLPEFLSRAGASKEPLEPRDIRARLVLAMINEAAKVLEDGIVSTAGDLDLAMIMGTGFPPFRGGLLRFADSVHPRTIHDRLMTLQSAHGDRFKPADLIATLAHEDREFYTAFPVEFGVESTDAGL